MKLFKIVNIDMGKCRDRVNGFVVDVNDAVKPLYEYDERKALLELYDLFEAGKFKEAVEMIVSWDRDWREYVDEEINDVLYDIFCGEEYQLAEKG